MIVGPPLILCEMENLARQQGEMGKFSIFEPTNLASEAGPTTTDIVMVVEARRHVVRLHHLQSR